MRAGRRPGAGGGTATARKGGMTRFGGFLITGLLLILAFLLHASGQAAADALADGETRGRETIHELYRRSQTALARGEAHPGLEALLEPEAGDDLGLTVLTELGSEQLAFARDEAYVYGLATTFQSGFRRRYGFAIRAWPLDFGRTGDREFTVTEAGYLLEGFNPKGRSGHAKDELPPLPTPGLDDPHAPWILIWQDPDIPRGDAGTGLAPQR